ncbi:MAG: ABC transporter permease [Desulfovibrio sp.]|nr:ABC transporter permease [Desulfovibrio sp.]MBI4958762.1 ABC transporter permease [Desulfovibrio sp.]
MPTVHRSDVFTRVKDLLALLPGFGPATGGCPAEYRSASGRVLRLSLYSLNSLKAHGLRSIFSVISIALGVASVTITKAVVDGADARLEEFVEWFGADAAFITGGDIYAQLSQRKLTLTRGDVEAVVDQLPGVRMVTSGRNIRSVSVSREAKAYETQVLVGSSPPFCQSWNWDLEEGEDITGADAAVSRKVCLLGETVSRELFGNDSPVGQTVTIGKHIFTVKGRLAVRGFSSGQTNMDDRVIIPLSTLTRYFNQDPKYVNGLRIRFHDANAIAENLENLRGLLRHRHGIRPEFPDDFSIVSSSEIIRFLKVLKHGIGIFLGAFSAVTLAVGGIVLANLTYVVIDQRKQEIGILMAVGARRRDILVQFMSEIAFLCLAGAVSGMVLSLAATAWINHVQVFTVSFSPSVWVVGLLGASVVAFVFGLAPAMSAAKMDPVQSLSEG